MTTKLRTVLIAKLMTEDHSGLAYCFNHMKWKTHTMWGTYTKRELREKLTDLTEEELKGLSSFRTFKPLFSETPIRVQISSGVIYSVSVESEDFTVGKDNHFYITLDRFFESDRKKRRTTKHKVSIILNN